MLAQKWIKEAFRGQDGKRSLVPEVACDETKYVWCREGFTGSSLQLQ
jgi:hypothetical protein